MKAIELTDEQRTAHYAAPRQQRDRPAYGDPGGMECQECSGIFIGSEGHSYCALCYAVIFPEMAGQ